MPVDIVLTCPCGCQGYYILNELQVSLDYWRSQANAGYAQNCVVCGCRFALVDQTTQIGLSDISSPRVDTIDQKTGPLAGGTTVTLSGHRLNFATPAVTFDGVPATIIGTPTNDTLVASSPPGHYQMVAAGSHQRKLVFSGANGTFQVGEGIHGTQLGGWGVIRAVFANYLYVDSVFLTFQANEPIVGVKSGATATATSLGGDFQVGETITGQSSNATATVVQPNPLRVSTPTGTFTPGEMVLGGTTAARVLLSATTAVSKAAVIGVSNTNGARFQGASYYSFLYT